MKEKKKKLSFIQNIAVYFVLVPFAIYMMIKDKIINKTKQKSHE